MSITYHNQGFIQDFRQEGGKHSNCQIEGGKGYLVVFLQELIGERFIVTTQTRGSGGVPPRKILEIYDSETVSGGF